MLAVVDDGRIVAGAGAYPQELTLPGGPVACAGVTVVGVLPSHRRRGLLRRMMEAQLRDVRERGEPVAALWASEETIYGRFGYGLASMGMHVEAKRDRVRIRPELPREGSFRLIDHDETLRVVPRLYERIRKRTPGFLARSTDWWEARRIGDRPETRRGAGPLVRALYERDGAPAGYALYRIAQDGATFAEWTKTVRVLEVVGIDEAARRDIWRFLLEIDWTDTLRAEQLAVDDALPLLVDRVNELGLRVYDGLWVRPIDVPAALAARETAADGRVTHRRDGRSAVSRQRRDVDPRGRRAGQAVVAASGRPHRRPGARVGVARRLHVRAARTGRSRGGGRAGRARPSGRTPSGRARPVVPRDLLTATPPEYPRRR